MNFESYKRNGEVLYPPLEKSTTRITIVSVQVIIKWLLFAMLWTSKNKIENSSSTAVEEFQYGNVCTNYNLGRDPAV